MRDVEPVLQARILCELRSIIADSLSNIARVDILDNFSSAEVNRYTGESCESCPLNVDDFQ